MGAPQYAEARSEYFYPTSIYVETTVTCITDNYPKVHFICGVQSVRHSFIEKLTTLGFQYDTEGSVILIIDIQRGFALRMLKDLANSPRRRDKRIVVVTFSLRNEYLEDLWDLHPDVLIVDANYEHEYSRDIIRASNGEQYRMLPKQTSPVTVAERRVLSKLAQGRSNKQIAAELYLHEKTVMNILTVVYRKLHIQSRMQAVLYYWGIDTRTLDM